MAASRNNQNEPNRTKELLQAAFSPPEGVSAANYYGSAIASAALCLAVFEFFGVAQYGEAIIVSSGLIGCAVVYRLME